MENSTLQLGQFVKHLFIRDLLEGSESEAKESHGIAKDPQC